MIRFAEFELDARAYQLRRSGHALKIERIPMEVLLLLTEHPSELVTREQIVERIWGKGHYLDTDNSINGAIRKIRQLLRDDSDEPRFIQTVTGRGYRFIAAVTVVVGEPVPPAPVAPLVPAPTVRTRRPWLATGAVVAVVGVAVAAVWVLVPHPPASAGRVMIAVLPFQNFTGDAGQEYFSDGLTEEIIAQLGSVAPQRVQVIARTSVMHYKTRPTPLAEIARELRVQYVLEGSVRREADTMRVTAQLIQTNDQTHLWAQRYDREPRGLLTLQSEIAQHISSAIHATLGADSPRPTGVPVQMAQDYEAYELYLKGLHFFNQRTIPAFARAIGFLEQATARDPDYARAHALLADAYTLQIAWGGGPVEPAALAKARAAALRALELDPNSAEAHTALALIVQNHDLDWKTAEREFKRAIELNPNYATAHHWYAEHLTCRGLFDEALRESNLALQLDPLSLIIATDRGWMFYYARQYDRAVEAFRFVLDRDSTFGRAHHIYETYRRNGMIAEMRAYAERYGRRPPSDPWGRLVHFYQDGDTTQVRQAFAELQAYGRRHPVGPWAYAAGFMALGEEDSALAWLERSYATGTGGGLTSLKVEPAWDPLRGDPRFQSLLRRVGLEP